MVEQVNYKVEEKSKKTEIIGKLVLPDTYYSTIQCFRSWMRRNTSMSEVKFFISVWKMEFVNWDVLASKFLSIRQVKNKNHSLEFGYSWRKMREVHWGQKSCRINSEGNSEKCWQIVSGEHWNFKRRKKVWRFLAFSRWVANHQCE